MMEKQRSTLFTLHLPYPAEGVWGKSFPPAGSKGRALGQRVPRAEPLAVGDKQTLDNVDTRCFSFSGKEDELFMKGVYSYRT